jgi:L-rhamnose mutarotase
MRRFGQLIGLKPDQIEEYERLHAAVWPEVLAMISVCNIRNYSIFLTLCLLSVTPSLKERSSYPNSTAIRHTERGAPLWFHGPTHQGQLTSAPFSPSPAG